MNYGIFFLLIAAGITALLFFSIKKNRAAITIMLIVVLAATFFVPYFIFPMISEKVQDADPTTVTASPRLEGIIRDGRVIYLVQHGNQFQFLTSNEEGLELTSAEDASIVIEYSETLVSLTVKETATKYHLRWHFLRSPVKEEVKKQYLFTIPRDAVWYE